MDFRAVCAILKEKPGRVAYWRDVLKQHGLIEPKKGVGNKDIYREEDVQQMLRLKQLLNDGVPTVTEAIRLMKDGLTPHEAYSLYQQAQRQITLLQKKVLQLRKPFWKRIVDWFKGLFTKRLSSQPE